MFHSDFWHHFPKVILKRERHGRCIRWVRILWVELQIKKHRKEKAKTLCMSIAFPVSGSPGKALTTKFSLSTSVSEDNRGNYWGQWGQWRQNYWHLFIPSTAPMEIPFSAFQRSRIFCQQKFSIFDISPYSSAAFFKRGEFLQKSSLTRIGSIWNSHLVELPSTM